MKNNYNKKRVIKVVNYNFLLALLLLICFLIMAAISIYFFILKPQNSFITKDNDIYFIEVYKTESIDDANIKSIYIQDNDGAGYVLKQDDSFIVFFGAYPSRETMEKDLQKLATSDCFQTDEYDIKPYVLENKSKTVSQNSNDVNKIKEFFNYPISTLIKDLHFIANSMQEKTLSIGLAKKQINDIYDTVTEKTKYISQMSTSDYKGKDSLLIEYQKISGYVLNIINTQFISLQSSIMLAICNISIEFSSYIQTI